MDLKLPTIGLEKSDASRDKRNKGIGASIAFLLQKRGRYVTPVILFPISSFLRSFLYFLVSFSFLQEIIGKIGGAQK